MSRRAKANKNEQRNRTISSHNFNFDRIFNNCIASLLSFEYQSSPPPSPSSSRDIGNPAG